MATKTATSPPATQTARYEFRIFGDDCRAIGERIERSATAQGEDQNHDIYILATAVDDQNCKIRAGHLEVKARLAEEANLEQWQPTLDQPFPVPAAWLCDKLFPTLQKTAPELARNHYTQEQLLAEVVGVHPELSALALTKHRRFFTVNSCRIEVGEIQIAAQLPLFTIALEAEQAALVRQTQAQLGLPNYANTNYVQRLKQLL